MRVARVPLQMPNETIDAYTERLANLYTRVKTLALRNILVERMAPYVWALLTRRSSTREDIHDIWSHVIVYSVIPSTEKYDLAHNTKYVTYITHQVNFMIANYYREMRIHGVKIPRDAYELLRQLEVSNAIEVDNTEEMPDVMRCKIDRVKMLRNSVSLDGHLDANFWDGRDSRGIEIAVDDPCAASIDRMHITDTMRRIVSKLPAVRQRFIELYYYESMSLQAVADRLGVSYTNAGQIHYCALQDLRRYSVIITDALQGIDPIAEERKLRIENMARN